VPSRSFVSLSGSDLCGIPSLVRASGNEYTSVFLSAVSHWHLQHIIQICQCRVRTPQYYLNMSIEACVPIHNEHRAKDSICFKRLPICGAVLHCIAHHRLGFHFIKNVNGLRTQSTVLTRPANHRISHRNSSIPCLNQHALFTGLQLMVTKFARDRDMRLGGGRVIVMVAWCSWRTTLAWITRPLY